MTNMFVLAGNTPEAAATKAAGVFALETALADSSLSPVQMRDPKALVHKMTVRELGLLAPGFDWAGYLKGVGLPALAAPGTVVDVSVPGFVQQAVRLLNDTPLETWRAYLEWNVVRGRSNWCGQKFFDESFAFQAKLVGSRAPQPRWKRAATVCDGMMGEALGKAFVEENFPPSSKARMVEMVDNLQAALRERIASRPWMSEATKKQGTRKLDAILKKIGYPDRWRDYSGLVIDPALPAATNLAGAAEFQRRFELSLIGKPVDRTMWLMSPPTVNAYYNPTFNEIVFPAGSLPPQSTPTTP
jgi:predicted metalloendopeptidase